MNGETLECVRAALSRVRTQPQLICWAIAMCLYAKSKINVHKCKSDRRCCYPLVYYRLQSSIIDVCALVLSVRSWSCWCVCLCALWFHYNSGYCVRSVFFLFLPLASRCLSFVCYSLRALSVPLLCNNDEFFWSLFCLVLFFLAHKQQRVYIKWDPTNGTRWQLDNKISILLPDVSVCLFFWQIKSSANAPTATITQIVTILWWQLR